MRNLAPTLLAFASIPASFALEVYSGENGKLSITGQVQIRADLTKATGNDDKDFNVISGTADSQPHVADFYLRRTRLNISGNVKNQFDYFIALRADNAGKPTTSTGDGADRHTQVHQAFASKTFKGDTISHTVRGGLFIPNYNPAYYGSSVTLLLPDNRRTYQTSTPLGGGASYTLSAPYIAKFDVTLLGNNGADADNGGADKSREGQFYSTRLELTGSDSLRVEKVTESFLGKEGTGFLIGLEAGINDHDRTKSTGTPATGRNNQSTTRKTYGTDALFHWNALTAIADVKFANQTDEPDVGDSVDTKQRIWSVQAGWAIPGIGDGLILEPAARYTSIDNNTEIDDEEPNPGTAGGALNSGKLIEAGANLYFGSHANKLQAAIGIWKAEAGSADATIGSLQYQFVF